MIIINDFIAIIKLFLSQSMVLTSFWFSSKSHWGVGGELSKQLWRA